MIINPYRFSSANDPYFSSVVLLAHWDGTNGSTTFVDSSSYARSITSTNGIALTTTSPKFGTACLNADGTDDYALCSASNDFSFSTGTDFTIEYWLKTNSGGPSGCGITLTGNTLYVAVLSSTIYFGNGGVNMVTGSWTHNQWNFVQAVRSGSTCEMWVNGSSLGTYGTSVSIGANAALNIMYAPVWGEYGQGQMDDLRITKGVARANVVPSAAFPDS